MSLTREAILQAQDRKTESVNVPEWGGDVIVSTMTGTQRDAFEQSLRVGGSIDLTNARAKLVAASIVDESGNAIFSATDVEALGAKSFSALDRIADAARKLNKLGSDEAEAAQGN